MSMLTLTSAVEKRLPDKTQVSLLDGTTSARVGRERITTKVPVIRHLPQSIPVKGISRSIEVKIASCESEWEQAFALAAASYQERGYESPGSNRLRFTPYHALPDTVTLVAKHEEQVLATFSIVMDNTLLGLPMEGTYPEEISALRRRGRKMFEATTLADGGLNVREFVQVFLTLIKLSMQYHTSHGGDSYVIAVNPRHKKFYTKIMGFVPLGPLRTYAAVQDAPAEAFLLDNRLLKTNAPDTYEQMFGQDLPTESLIAPKMPRAFIRQFSRQSSLCDCDEIQRILDFTDKHGSMRRW
jgi:hypothetical protein